MNGTKHLFFRYLVVGLACIALTIFSILGASHQIQAQDFSGLSSNACQQIIKTAFDRVHQYCNKLERNSACYGNNAVSAQFNGESDESEKGFDTVGDKVSVKSLRTLNVSGFDLDKGLWGLSLLKLQANIPDTLPGQNVLFLVYGNTDVENPSGDMQSFYFTSGLGKLDCKDTPRDAIVVRSPNHMAITFTANGVEVSIASTLIMHAERHKQMELHLVEGRGTITTPLGTQNIRPGEVVTVQLGGANGLEPISAPSKPLTAATAQNLPNIICLLNRLEGKLCQAGTSPQSSTPLSTRPNTSNNEQPTVVNNGGNSAQPPNPIYTPNSPNPTATFVSNPTNLPAPTILPTSNPTSPPPPTILPTSNPTNPPPTQSDDDDDDDD